MPSLQLSSRNLKPLLAGRMFPARDLGVRVGVKGVWRGGVEGVGMRG